MDIVRTHGRRRLMPLLVAVVLIAILAAPAAFAQDGTSPAPPAGYTGGAQGYLRDDGEFTPIQFPGATGTIPFGINDKGQIVGFYDDPQGRTHGFLFERGQYRTIDHPDATGTLDPEGLSGNTASSINNKGQVVGAYVGPDNHVHAYLLDLKQDQFRPIPDAPGATDTNAFGLNDRGQITIQADSPEDPFLNFLFDDGEFTPIQFPDAVTTAVHKIDNRGQIVGAYTGSDGILHGFIFRHGRYRTLDFPGATFTSVVDSNSRGQLVGWVAEFAGDPPQPTAAHGALLSRGKLTTFDYPGPLPGPTATDAIDINNRGQIVGAQYPFLIPALQRAQVADQVPLLSDASTDSSKERDRAKDRDRDRRRQR